MFWEVGLPTDPWAFGGPIWLFEDLEGEAGQHPDKAQLPFSLLPITPRLNPIAAIKLVSVESRKTLATVHNAAIFYEKWHTN